MSESLAAVCVVALVAVTVGVLGLVGILRGKSFRVSAGRDGVRVAVDPSETVTHCGAPIPDEGEGVLRA